MAMPRHLNALLYEPLYRATGSRVQGGDDLEYFHVEVVIDGCAALSSSRTFNTMKYS
jgi:hypothetical protein